MLSTKRILKLFVSFAIAVNLSACYGRSCYKVSRYINYVFSPSYSEDGEKIAFIYRNGEKDHVIDSIYITDKYGDNLKLIKKVETEIIEDKPLPEFDLKWLENGDLLFQKIETGIKIDKLLEINLNGEIIKEKNDIDLDKFHSTDPVPLDIAFDNSYTTFSFDGRYSLNNLNLFDLEKSENSKLIIDDEKFNALSDVQDIRVNLLPSSQNKVHIQYSYKLQKDKKTDSEFELQNSIGHFIGTLDTTNKKITNLISFNSNSKEHIDIISADDKEIFYKSNNSSEIIDIYKIDILNNKEEKIVTYDIKDNTYNQSDYLVSSNNIIKWYFLDKSFTSFSTHKNKKLNISLRDLPLGEEVSYIECSTSTL